MKNSLLKFTPVEQPAARKHGQCRNKWCSLGNYDFTQLFFLRFVRKFIRIQSHNPLNSEWPILTAFNPARVNFIKLSSYTADEAQLITNGVRWKCKTSWFGDAGTVKGS